MDLDHDGRVCFAEFEAFCKKAQRAIRRRGIAGVAGAAKASPVPPRYLKDRALERLFAAYCYLGTARPAAGGKAMLDERRFLRLLKDAKLTGPPPKMQTHAAQLCFAESRRKNERRLDFRTFLASLGGVASHAGATFDDVATAVKAVPAPGKSGGGGGEAPARLPSFMAPLNKTPGRPSTAAADDASSSRRDGFGVGVAGGSFGSPIRPATARGGRPSRRARVRGSGVE